MLKHFILTDEVSSNDTSMVLLNFIVEAHESWTYASRHAYDIDVIVNCYLTLYRVSQAAYIKQFKPNGDVHLLDVHFRMSPSIIISDD